MAVDPYIARIFGEPPAGIDLHEKNTAYQSALGLLILICVAALAVILRFCARLIQRAPVKADDYFIILAMALTSSTVAVTVLVLKATDGRHVWALTMEDLVWIVKLQYFQALFFILGVWAIKTSVLMLYVRLFSLHNKGLRICFYVGAFLSFALGLSGTVTMLVACRPIHVFWTQYRDGVGSETCINAPVFSMLYAILNVALDLYVVVIPIPHILKLQMRLWRKVAICISLMMAVFACAAGVLRIYYNVIYTGSPDYAWTLGPISFWLCMEPVISVTTACLPNLLPLCRWAADRVRRSLRRWETCKSKTARSSSRIPDSTKRLPSYPEDHHNDLKLRPQHEDEMRLTSLTVAAMCLSSEEDMCERGIVVRREFVLATLEDRGKTRNANATDACITPVPPAHRRIPGVTRVTTL